MPPYHLARERQQRSHKGERGWGGYKERGTHLKNQAHLRITHRRDAPAIPIAIRSNWRKPMPPYHQAIHTGERGGGGRGVQRKRDAPEKPGAPQELLFLQFCPLFFCLSRGSPFPSWVAELELTPSGGLMW